MSLWLACLGAALLGCGHRKQMIDDSVTLVQDMLVLLEENVEKPEGAILALREFMLENRLRMMRLHHFNEKRGHGLTREEQIRMNVRFLRKIEPLKERLEAVAKIYKGHPEVMEKMKNVIQNVGYHPGEKSPGL